MKVNKFPSPPTHTPKKKEKKNPPAVFCMVKSLNLQIYEINIMIIVPKYEYDLHFFNNFLPRKKVVVLEV